jgi:hypothetical protein
MTDPDPGSPKTNIVHNTGSFNTIVRQPNTYPAVKIVGTVVRLRQPNPLLQKAQPILEMFSVKTILF